MRMQRILVSLLTFALIGLVPIAFSSSAEAAKPKREIGATNKSRNSKVFITGKVKPGSKTKVIIQRRGEKQKKWRGYRTIRTNGKGKYTFRAPGGPKVGQTQCYRIVVPGNKKFRKSFQAKITFGSAKGAKICITRFA